MIAHDEIIKKNGGSFGRFQKFALSACTLSYASDGFLVYNLVYLCLMPDYSCVGEDGVSVQCSAEQTCESGTEFSEGKVYV